MNAGSDHQDSTAGSKPAREYRIRAQHWLIAISCGLFFAAFGVFSTYSAWFNIDGSFPHPFEMAIVFAICWSCSFLLAMWLLCFCWRERLRITDKAIFQQRCFSSTEIPFQAIDRLIWLPNPIGGRIVIHSQNDRIKIEFGVFTTASQQELISWFRERFPLSIQAGWREFEICVLGVDYYPPAE